ncbi:MAG: Kazal-type serine protease inhibitor domain-containing protein [Candidatus Micrarchaeota archaeon]
MKAYLAAMLMLAMLAGGCLGPVCPEVDDPVCGSDGTTYKNACFAQQAGISSVRPGQCGPSGCTDSDGGKELFTIGQAVDGSGTYDDECADSLRVDEVYCEEGKAMVKTIACPTGYECLAGACVESECSDSDGGQDETERGTVEMGSESQSDSCASSAKVTEYYCSAGKAVSKDIACEAGFVCEDGACVESACEDSDGGKDASKAGTTSKGALSQEDSCLDKSLVREYYCLDNGITSEEIDCASGYECISGRCVQSRCLDSDGGKDQYTEGTASYGDVSQADTCYSDSQVIEYFCASATTISNERISCGTGHECLDGRCQQIECEKQTSTVNEAGVDYEIAEYDDLDPLTMYMGDSVVLNDGLVLKVYSVSGTNAIFRVYLNYEDLKDNDIECAVTIAQGNSQNDLCGKDTRNIEVVTVNDADGYVELVLDEYYAMEYYSLQGTVDDWTDDPSCPEDTARYASQVIEFFPRIDTDPSGLDLEGESFAMFGEDARLLDVGTDTVSFRLDGEDHEDLEDGDTFEYLGEDYELQLTFNDGGLVKMEIDLD